MFEGVFTAIVTPFTENDKIDEDNLRKLVDFQIENGISGIVPIGTTGEAPTLSHREKLNVIEIVLDQANKRVPVIAGTGTNSTRRAIDLTLEAQEIGIDGTLQVAPYYNKPTQKGFYRHFKNIAAAIDTPIIIYNIPGRTGKNIETETIAELSKIPNIVAVKEASGSLSQMMDVIENTPDDFDVLSGDDNLTLPLMAAGGKGVVSVASNVVPDRMMKMVNAGLNGDFKTMRSLYYELKPLFNVMFIETNPIPIKTTMTIKGMMEENFRLPMCEINPESREKLKTVLKKLNII